MRTPQRLLLSLAVTASLAFGEAAQGALVTFDENGHGNIDGAPLLYAVVPGPAGVAAPVTLKYSPPVFGSLNTTLGTLAIYDLGGQVLAELVMFDGFGDIWFYSERDLADLTPDLADVGTTGVPAYGSVTTIIKNGPAGSNDIFYAPLGGSNAGYSPGVSYHIITANTPEPSVLALAGLVPLVALLRRRAFPFRPCPRGQTEPPSPAPARGGLTRPRTGARSEARLLRF